MCGDCEDVVKMLSLWRLTLYMCGDCEDVGKMWSVWMLSDWILYCYVGLFWSMQYAERVLLTTKTSGQAFI